MGELKEGQTLLTMGLFVGLAIWETVAPHFKLFKRPTDGQRVRHDLINIFIGVVNIGMASLIFAGLWLAAAAWSREEGFGLIHRLNLTTTQATIATLLILDVWTYWWHRLAHTVPFLWRFHHVHHSDPTMDVSTAYRFHIGEMFLSHCIRLAIIPLAGMELWQVVLFDIVLFTNVQFHHANIGIGKKLDWAMRLVLTSPEMHKVHHSNRPQDFNSNYTALLSVWDRIFGSYRILEGEEVEKFGLPGFDKAEKQTISALFLAPIKLFRR